LAMHVPNEACTGFIACRGGIVAHSGNRETYTSRFGLLSCLSMSVRPRFAPPTSSSSLGSSCPPLLPNSLKFVHMDGATHGRVKRAWLHECSLLWQVPLCYKQARLPSPSGKPERHDRVFCGSQTVSPATNVLRFDCDIDRFKSESWKALCCLSFIGVPNAASLWPRTGL
jgi:hypothetical protein